jgi:hypothetical protein
MNEEYYVVSYDGNMIAMVTIKEVGSFNSEKFISDLTKDGYKVQCVSKEQKDILLPKDISLN